MAFHALGIDFGSLSARALLIDTRNGNIVGEAESVYEHAVMDKTLCDGASLPADYALQHPADYLAAMGDVVKGVLETSGLKNTDIGCVCLDFTGSTVMPTTADGTPLCFLDKYKNNRHAYVKMWKHHAAAAYADRLVKIAETRKEPFLALYSGKVSGEWLIPKLWQILDEDAALYDDIDTFIEAGDWMVWMLTGVRVRNACAAGYKALWQGADVGYPSKEFFAALDKRLENVVSEKLKGEVLPLGKIAGTVDERGAKMSGLAVGTPVTVSLLDAHAAFPASGITTPGKLLMIMGTSSVQLALGKDIRPKAGICGIVKDGILPGYYAYETGQTCVGDHFDWFVKNYFPASYAESAKKEGMNAHEYLTMLAERKKPGESGVIALDWWNGCRTDLMDETVSGLFIGMTLATKPEDLYRALIEATAFGTRKVIDVYESAGVPVDEVYACGGLAAKNAMLMQIYADVTGKPIRVLNTKQAGAVGCAILAAVAGKMHATLADAAEVMAVKADKVYTPDADNAERYAKIYKEYLTLHDLFAENGMMKRLRGLAE